MDKQLILYTGPHCSLCDKAKREVWPILAETGQQLKEVDITSDIALLREYRVSIPVLATADGSTLRWPFDGDRIRQWLQETHQ